MPLDLYREWKAKHKDVGCVFARLIALTEARDPARYKYRSEVVNGGEPTAVATEIAARVTAGIGEQGLDGLALVLPGVTTMKVLVKMADALEGCPGWKVTRSKLKGKPFGEAVAFHITRDLPYEGKFIPSEALILGPFRTFPKTRRSPVTALEIYVGVPAPAIDFMGQPTTKANLALIEVAASLKPQLAQKTKLDRLESLNGIDDQRAKARVTFSVPKKMAASLGCAL